MGEKTIWQLDSLHGELVGYKKKLVEHKKMLSFYLHDEALALNEAYRIRHRVHKARLPDERMRFSAYQHFPQQ